MYYRVASVPGVVGVLLLAIRVMPLVPDRLISRIRYLGGHSLVFYVSHLLAIKIAATLLERAGLTATWLMLPALVVVGVGVGWLLTVLSGRWAALRLLFALPVAPSAQRVASAEGRSRAQAQVVGIEATSREQPVRARGGDLHH